MTNPPKFSKHRNTAYVIEKQGEAWVHRKTTVLYDSPTEDCVEEDTGKVFRAYLWLHSEFAARAIAESMTKRNAKDEYS